MYCVRMDGAEDPDRAVLNERLQMSDLPRASEERGAMSFAPAHVACPMSRNGSGDS